MTTALITGVVGQDGAYLARSLHAKGYRVIGTTPPAFDPDGFVEAYLPGVEMRRVDLTDEAGMRGLVDAERPDEIYNLAAISSVAASWQVPMRVARVNGLAFQALLDSVRVIRDADGYDPRICLASSAEIFGAPASLPVTEAHPLQPANPYAVAKAFAHLAARTYREGYGLYVATAVLFNHESPLRPAAFVTRKITAAAVEIASGRREYLELGRLDIRRDWGSARDYVDAMHRALQAERPDEYCIATGRSHSVQELAEMALAAAGVEDSSGRIRIDPSLVRPADITEMVGDPTKARTILGWQSTESLQDVVRGMVFADRARDESHREHDPRYM